MKKILNKSKCFYSAAIMAIILLACILSVQPAYATSFDWAVAVESAPVPVNGRTLSGVLAGDPKSDWLEIAQNGRYSLIIRKNFINWYTQPSVYGNPDWQATPYGSWVNAGTKDKFEGRIFSKSEYNYSHVRSYINKWFLGSGYPAADKLPANARMRNYTMYSTAIGRLGTSCRERSLTDGFSKPTPYQVGTGKDIAFLLSFSEAANYCSVTTFLYGTPISTIPSPAIAISNYNQMLIPKNKGMWLRSPSDTDTMKNAAAIMSSSGRVFQDVKTQGLYLLYPAVWVDQDIFDPNSNRTRVHVTGTVAANSVRSNRILPARMTGDYSDWIEIANYQGYSLILRANFINTYPWRYGELEWQPIGYGPYDYDYMESYVRDHINNWYNHSMYLRTNGELPDHLPKDARLRRFAVYSNVASDDVLGTCCRAVSLVDGFSTPTSYNLGVGDDVAFALSFSEAAAFCSTHRYFYYGEKEIPPQKMSVIDAQNNYMKLAKPPVGGNRYAIWLRSPGDNYYKEHNFAGSLDGYTNGITDMTGIAWHNSVEPVKNSFSFPHPAMWVGEGIFEDDPNVTYKPNGGVGADVVDYVSLYNDYIIKDNPGYYRNGYDFVCWNDKEDGTGEEFWPNDSTTITRSLILYAQWENVQSVRVTYEPNGATVGSSIYFDVKIGDFHSVIPNPAYEKTGHVFNGWNDRSNGSGTIYMPGSLVYIDKNLTLYAQWISEPRTVTYYPNEGVGSPRVDNVSYDDSYQISGPTYERDGYSFSEWNTMADGSGTKYTNGQWIVIKDSLVLYAQWKPNSLTVTYDPNNGSGNRNVVNVNYDMHYKIVDQGYSRFGYRQNGWNTMPNGTGTPYTNDQVIIIKASIVLYAQWEANSYTVTYHPNGGVGDIKTETVYYGTTYTVVDQGYTYSGHGQSGWNTQPDGKGTSYANGQSFTIQDSVTLYAQWEPIQLTVTYYPNGGTGNTVIAYVAYDQEYKIENQGYTKQLYEFESWNTQANGNGIGYQIDQIIKMTDNIILYAIWIPIM